MTDELKYKLEFPQEEQVYSSTDSVSKDKVISVRLEEALFNLLQAQGEQWNSKSISNTVRTILSMYFLPAIYEFEWKNITPEKIEHWQKEELERGFSVELSRYNKFNYEVLNYLEFINEGLERGNVSVQFMYNLKDKLETILKETQSRFHNVLLDKDKQGVK